MDQLKKERRVKRTAITKVLAAVEAKLQKPAKDQDQDALQVSLTILVKHMEKLEELDEKVTGLMLQNSDTTDQEIEAEDEACSTYMKRAELVKHKINKILYPPVLPRSPSRSEAGNSSTSSVSKTKRNFKLPKVELKEFSGDLKEWLGWWAQFQKIDEDEDLHTSDKFSYLTQCMVKGSRAAELVASYPQSAKNYPKVIEALKQRFGNSKILQQVYVRELISMIISNRNAERVVLSSMFDKLTAHLRSLESLGVTLQQSAVFLYPLVESALPEEILRAWQRSPSFGKSESEEDGKSELDFLMQFLRQEIEHEEQRKLARSGFGSNDRKKHQRKRDYEDTEDVPTAAGLFSGSSEKSGCVFCGKGGHHGKSCFKAPKMTLEERQQLVKKAKVKVCFVCLKWGHLSKQCRNPEKCPKCGKSHCALLCSSGSDKKSSEQGQSKDIPQTVQSNLNCTSAVILRTLILWIGDHHSGSERKVRALLDCGSQRSYVLSSTAEELGLRSVKKVTVDHQLFGGGEIANLKHNIFDIVLSSTSGPFKTTIRVMDQNQLCGNIPRVPVGSVLTALEKKGIRLSDVDQRNSMEVELLIGADFLGEILTGRIHRLHTGAVATETKFGWCLMGPMEDGCVVKSVESDNLALSVVTMTVSCATVPELWKLETIGISDPAESQSKEERDASVVEHFQRTVKRMENGRYSVSLPWVSNVRKFPSNRDVAFRRLESTTRKLISLGKFDDYDTIFKTWESEGLISELKDQDGALEVVGCHYLPHRAVIKTTSLTTPVRPVFDASCKVGRAPSLNEMLEKGPNLLEQIPAVLLRFRMGRIGVISDIRKAFMMIELNDEDRKAVRFLWWKDPKRKEVIVYQHNRVVFGVNCSPFLLGAVIHFHLRQYKDSNPEVVSLLKNSLYVDNCVASLDSESEFEMFKTTSTRILADAMMELRMWERSKEQGENEVTNALGMRWNKVKDELSCVTLSSQESGKVTKKIMLSHLHQIFDPLGFLSPVLITPKILLQKAWAEKKQWEEEVSEPTGQEFLKWWSEILPVLDSFSVPRNCSGGIGWDRANMQLHVFSDASKLAYAAAVFLRVKTDGGVSIQLLQSKARVAPVKSVTIPRLELLGCTIAARLVTSVKKALSFDDVQTFFWSDSATVLSWIKRNDEWGTFVGNRVREILQLTKGDDWRHVPGVMNPADLPSRGIDPSKFISSRWWEGPAWLKLESEQWPSNNYEVNDQEVDVEKKRRVLTSQSKGGVVPTSWFVVRGTYSSNLRVFCFVFRFLDKVRGKSSVRGKLPTVSELNSTERRLIKLVQNEELSVTDGRVGDIRVTTDTEEIIRVRTKILHRQDTTNFRTPMLLPNRHPLVDLLILHQHRLGCHGGAQFTMGSLREKYWIIRGREAVKRILKSCVVCQRFTSQKVEVPTPALPEDRVNDVRAYGVTGVDLAGPLYLKDNSKAYIVLFTCAVFRGLHLELVQSISTEDFLLAFTRFCMRKTRPSIIYSDNGTNFVGAENLFKKINWDQVQQKTNQHKIQWKFNPPSAPWWGGWWERLVRSVKDLLKRTLGFRKLNYVELETSLCEVEFVVNSRPLTFITEDQDDLVALTPAMFHYNMPVTTIPEAEVITLESLGRRKKTLDKLFDDIRGRFRKEYLGLLVQRGKELMSHRVQVGDYVLVGDESKKRIMWPMARVAELIPGKDGVERVARLKTKNGELLRPVQRLYPLEFPQGDVGPPALRQRKVTAAPRTYVDDEESVTSVEEKTTRSGRVSRKPMRFCEY